MLITILQHFSSRGKKEGENRLSNQAKNHVSEQVDHADYDSGD